MLRCCGAWISPGATAPVKQAAGSGTGAAEGGGQEPVVDKVRVSGAVGADPAAPARGREDPIQVRRDIVSCVRPSDPGVTSPEETGRERRVDDRARAGSSGRHCPVDLLEHIEPWVSQPNLF